MDLIDLLRFLIYEKSIKYFEDMGIIRVIEQFNILQLAERFDVGFHRRLADEIVQGHFLGVSDLARHLNGKFHSIPFILANDIIGDMEHFTYLFLGRSFALAQRYYMFSKSRTCRYKDRLTKSMAKVAKKCGLEEI